MKSNEERPYVVRVFDWEKTEDIYFGDEVISPEHRGICIGWTCREDGQYKVLVDNGDIEDWKNPHKGERWFSFHTISELVQTLRELNWEGVN